MHFCSSSSSLTPSALLQVQVKAETVVDEIEGTTPLLTTKVLFGKDEVGCEFLCHVCRKLYHVDIDADTLMDGCLCECECVCLGGSVHGW